MNSPDQSEDDNKLINLSTHKPTNKTKFNRFIGFSVHQSLKGFTLIELLLVITLILLIGATASPFLSRFLVQNHFETTQDKIISTIRKAQTYSMNNKNNAIWGICYTSNKIRLYQGSCLSPTISEDFDVATTITVSGLSDTTFSLLRGEPSQALTITISAFVGTTTVTLNRAGGITIN